jgi:hypothetical protein
MEAPSCNQCRVDNLATHRQIAISAQPIHDMGAQHLPGEEVWLVGEHRTTGERKYYLSNLAADTPIKQLAGAIKARWVC